MSYTTPRDRSDRRAMIDREQASSNRTDTVHFRGQMIDVKVVRLPIDIPVYRMKNGRAQVEQIEYIRDHQLAADFFEAGEENASAQNAQHSILLKLSKDQRANIYDELARVAKQQENVLVTADGVVVNGNRRLAAMRDLLSKDPTRYSAFSHVQAKILPPEATEEDLELVEAELQMAPELKLEYGWIERRLKLRRHLEVLKIPRSRIKETYRFRREEDMNVEVQQLALAEEFLEKYLGRPRDYRRVAQAEQLFKDLQKAVSGKSGDEAEVRRILGFILAKEAGKLEGRVYRLNPIFGKELERVLTEFARNRGITPVEAEKTIETMNDDPDDPLKGLESTEPSQFVHLRPILSDPAKSEALADELYDIFESIQAGKKEEDVRQAALKAIQQANRLLGDVNLAVSDPTTFPQIEGQLDAIIKAATSLKEELKKSQRPRI